MKTIKHNRHDGNGNIIETFEVPVKPSNVTDTEINITEEFLRGLAQKGRKGDTMKADYTNIGKTVYYKTDEGKRTEIKSMSCVHKGRTYDVTFETAGGTKIEKIIPVK